MHVPVASRTEAAQIAGFLCHRDIVDQTERWLFPLATRDAVDLSGNKRTLVLQAPRLEEDRQFGAQEQERLAAVRDWRESGVSPGKHCVLVHFVKRRDLTDAIIPILLREARIGRAFAHVDGSNFHWSGPLGRTD